jgi:hypothetical protein
MPNPTPKNNDAQQAPWKEHRRPDGSRALDFGKGPIDQKTLDDLCARVRRDFKGKPLDMKAAELKKLIDACNDGDQSATALHGAGRGEHNYFEPFQKTIGDIPKSFDEFVPASIKKEGDRIISVAQKVGYPIDAYNVAKADYANLLRQGANRLIYHQYQGHTDHGEELLRRLSKLGIEVPYEVVPVATVVAWKESWQGDSNIKLEKIGDETFGRSVQYALAFKPGDPGEADKLIKFFEKNANHKAKDGIAHSWKTPDIRASFVEPVGEFEQVVLNAKPSEHGFELLFLNKEPIDGFRASPIWINKELSRFAKSVSVYWIAPVIKPIVVTPLRKAIRVDKIVYRGGQYFARPAPSPVRFAITVKAMPLGTVRPTHDYITREGTPGHYKYEYPDDEEAKKKADVHQAMREDQSRGRKPPMSEEARDKTNKRLREMRDLLKTGNWGDISRVLMAYGIQQGSPEWSLAEEAFREHRKRFAP